MEADGRLGSAVEVGFQQLASAAVSSGAVARGFASSLPSRLRIRLQLAAMFAMAEFALLALAHNARAFRLKYRPQIIPSRPPPSPPRTSVLLPPAEANGVAPVVVQGNVIPPHIQSLLGTSSHSRSLTAGCSSALGERLPLLIEALLGDGSLPCVACLVCVSLSKLAFFFQPGANLPDG